MYTITMLDYNKKSSNFEVRTGPINAVTLAGVETQAGALAAEVDNVTLGTLKKEVLQAFDNLLSNVPPTDKHAQRSSRWLISYIDNTPFLDPPVNSIVNPAYQNQYSHELPTADPASLNVPNSDIVDLTAAPWEAFVTAYEALQRSPNGGQPKVVRIQYLDH